MGKKICISAITLFLTFVLGIVGYKILVGSHVTVLDCVYMTMITLATVGYGEIIDLSQNPAARIFTMFLIVIGMGNLLFLVSAMTSFLVDGRLNLILWRRKVMKTIEHFEHHFIVCGAGDTGMHIVDELVKTKKEFVVIEEHPELVETLKQKFPDAIIIDGDATEETVLRYAGIEKAKGIACVLPTDKDNLFLTVTAKQLNPHLRIIAKIISTTNSDKFIRAGAAAVVPQKFIGGLRVAAELIRPKVVDFLDLMIREKQNIRIEEVEVPEHSWIVGKKLEELGIRQKVGVQLIAIHDSETHAYNYYLDGKTVIPKKAALVAIGEPDVIARLEKFVHKG